MKRLTLAVVLALGISGCAHAPLDHMHIHAHVRPPDAVNICNNSCIVDIHDCIIDGQNRAAQRMPDAQAWEICYDAASATMKCIDRYISCLTTCEALY